MARLWIAGAVAAGLLSAGAAYAAGPAEDELVSIEAQWTKAAMARDFATVEKLLAPDWRGQNARGASTKAEMLAKSKADKDRQTSATNHDVHARIFGDIAVVQGLEDDKGMRDGKPYAETASWTDVFQKRDGHWLAIASQNTVLKPKT